MKKIPLTQGKFAIVDDADFEWLNQWKWRALKGSNDNWYAMRRQRQNSKRIPVYMHREILKPSSNMLTDHKDHNGLNNQRNNLRAATSAQNHQNRRKHRGISRFKGVCWNQQYAKWQAQIKVKGKHFHLGRFLSEIEAAKVYDKAATKFFGDFACTNF